MNEASLWGGSFFLCICFYVLSNEIIYVVHGIGMAQYSTLCRILHDIYHMLSRNDDIPSANAENGMSSFLCVTVFVEWCRDL